MGHLFSRWKSVCCKLFAMFIDEAKISLKAGDGGAGCVSFRREKYVPRGGPDGGNGGHGSKIIFVANKGESTLIRFRYKRIFESENGRPGESSSKHGRQGEDLILTVPCGTVIKDAESGDILCDLTEDRQEFTAVNGGRGGKGNEHFKSSRYQAPRFAQPGEPGERKTVLLVLKLLADVGLVGLPNAGKSTLISRLTAAKPKIADYPFTTLAPKIGVVAVEDDAFVMADMPGLIEGAHLGKGLGTRFLKHIERTSVICHLVDISDPDPEKILHDFEVIEAELKGYGHSLSEKREVVALTKIDALEGGEAPEEILRIFESRGIQTVPLSAVSGKNLEKFVRLVYELLREKRGS